MIRGVGVDMERSCAFTGHRPKKLPWRYDETAQGCVLLKKALSTKIEELVHKGITDYLSGMAEGTDTWAAEAVIALRGNQPFLKLHCILPCEGQESNWNEAAKSRYISILQQADTVTYVSRRYYDGCMLERNRYLVDHAAILLAVYNGERRGGTSATIRYARKCGRDIYIIDPVSYSVQHEGAD